MKRFADQNTGDAQAIQQLVVFLRERTGIRLPSSKQAYLEGRLRKRLLQLGFDSFDPYCYWLFEEDGMEEEECTLIDLATTNKTDFFREAYHFDFLLTEALPSLSTHAPLRIWSAGCANGAEPYSLAMLCQDYAKDRPGFQFEITASDISTQALREAVRAIYPHADIEPIPMPMRQRYLRRDVERDEVRIVAELRRKVKFIQHNLMDLPYPPKQPVDLLFCRNLLIYFDRPTQIEVLSRLCRCVKPGGYLILGHSENITGLELPLRSMAPTTFQRIATP